MPDGPLSHRRRERVPAEWFDQLYRADPDPWQFATSGYEARKFDLTAACLPRPRYRSAFEPGCAFGELTARLAPRCDALLAADAAPTVVARAARRFAGSGTVSVERRSVPEEWPAGHFDLVVLSEVAYYLTGPEHDELLERVVASLEPGGDLLAVHWTGAHQLPPRRRRRGPPHRHRRRAGAAGAPRRARVRARRLAAALSPLGAVVVVPARDEQDRIAACLAALVRQRDVDPATYRVLVVAHRCVDRTVAAVETVAAAHRPPEITVVELTTGGVGAARRAGMDMAAAMLTDAGAPGGLVATTDADTVVAPDWLAAQLALVAEGAEAIGGAIDLDPVEEAALPTPALAERATRVAARLAATRVASPAADHPFFSGASIGVTARAYLAAGGIPTDGDLEDEAFAAALGRAGVVVHRPGSVRVRTSARRRGRAGRGLAVDLQVASWRSTHSFAAEQFADVAGLARQRRDRVSVVFPAREEAATIGRVVATARRLVDAGLVDEVVVVDAAAGDGTADAAARAGAVVHQQDDLLAEFGPCRGKGDAMWRALSVVDGDIVCFLDADTANFDDRFVAATIGPLLVDASLALVKGAFTRPLRLGELQVPGEGGRVTELAARPALNLWFPELAGFDQPLSGEIALRRDLAWQLAFPVGYGVEVAMLIDAAAARGLDALAQVDLGERLNRHQPLRELSAMAYAVLAAAARRLPGGSPGPAPGPMLLPGSDGGPAEVRQVAVDERPPLIEVLGPGRASPGGPAPR
ncbi:MAG TPA: glucosyl-3-phosphoglycerate synthase [Acidimicrobiales bacterium]|nr:glucosyl-3-phosphoglycerate synthase [Acidimicrobiales bacterium]